MSAKGGADRRKFPRIPLRMRVNAVGRNQFISDFSSDVSEGGVGLQVPTPLEPGTRVTLHLFLPEQPKPLRARGRVVWAKTAPGPKGDRPSASLGIEFEEIEEGVREALRAYVQDRIDDGEGADPDRG